MNCGERYEAMIDHGTATYVQVLINCKIIPNPQKIQAWTGFRFITSAIPVQCSNNWAIELTQSWSPGEFAIYPYDRTSAYHSRERYDDMIEAVVNFKPRMAISLWRRQSFGISDLYQTLPKIPSIWKRFNDFLLFGLVNYPPIFSLQPHSSLERRETLGTRLSWKFRRVVYRLTGNSPLVFPVSKKQKFDK